MLIQVYVNIQQYKIFILTFMFDINVFMYVRKIYDCIRFFGESLLTENSITSLITADD